MVDFYLIYHEELDVDIFECEDLFLYFLGARSEFLNSTKKRSKGYFHNPQAYFREDIQEEDTIVLFLHH